MHQPYADLGSHNCHTANFVFHHAFRRCLCAARVVIGVAQDSVVAEFSRSHLEALDHFREEWILDVRNDNPQSTAIAGRQTFGMNIRHIPQPLHRGQNVTLRLRPNFTGVV